MLWAMLATMVAISAVIAMPFAVVVGLHNPAKPPPGINPKTGSPF